MRDNKDYVTEKDMKAIDVISDTIQTHSKIDFSDIVETLRSVDVEDILVPVIF